VAKYNERFKRKLVREYIAGKGGFKIIAGRYGIADSMLRKWVAAFRHHGTSGLQRRRAAYPADVKLKVLHRLWSENLSCRELAAIYNIGNPHSISTWEHRYRVGGIDALMPKRPGRHAEAMPGKKPQSAPPSSDSSEKRLLRENERLRAEVAYLKKVRALVLATKSAQQKERK